MTWTYQFLLKDRPRRKSCFGMMRDSDQKHFLVFISESGQVIFRTENFPSTTPLATLLRTIRESCMSECNFVIHRHPSGNHYFIVKCDNGHTLAISEMYVDRAKTEKHIKEVMKIGANAAVYYLPKNMKQLDEAG